MCAKSKPRMGGNRSPTAQRAIAAPSQVPKTLWGSPSAVRALERLVRIYGLPRDLDANPGGKAYWGSRELSNNPLCRIFLYDEEAPICYVCEITEAEIDSDASTHPAKDAIALCNAHVWLAGNLLYARGAHEHECITALTMIACTIMDLLHPEEIHDRSEFVEDWLYAAKEIEGYFRLEALLEYALGEGEDKSYEDFIEWLDE